MSFGFNNNYPIAAHFLYLLRAMNTKISLKYKHWTFSKSALVGLSATAADLFALFVMVEWFSIQTQWANVPALFIGIGIQFLGNKFYAFQNTDEAWLKQGLLFSLVETGALLVSAALFHFAVVVNGLPYITSRLGVGMLVYVCFSYPLWRYVFGRPASEEESVRPH